MARIKTAPLVNGGCYEKIMQDGRRFEAMIMGVQEESDGSRRGWLHRFGYPPEVVQEDTESFSGWDLVATPQKLEEPILSERKESAIERLQRENALLKRIQAKEEGKKTNVADTLDAATIHALRESGKTYADIGRQYGLAWQTVKSIHLTGA